MTTSIPFSHNGQEYEVRWMFDGETFHVRTFKDGRPANGFEYSTRFSVAYDLKSTRGEDAIAILVNDAKRDVLEGRWEKLLKAMEEIKRYEKEG